MAKILLIEDDAFLGKLYNDLFTGSGHQITLVADGEIAYQQIITGGWDLILLDMILPKMNAVQILDKIKAESPEKLKQKFLVLTNLEQDPMLEKIKQYDIEFVIKSKVNPDQLIDLVNKHL